MTYDALRRGRASEPGRAYFVTATAWQRRPPFRDMWAGRVLVREMRSITDAHGLQSLAWVVMPDHLHWLFQPGETADLAATMGQFKGRSAHALNRHLGRGDSVWQRAYFDHALREEEDIRAIARYIVANPLRAGLVDRLGDYPLWDAIWL